ncbi:MAG: sigma 54-interacting transcriptional regulator [Proteocatella sp.]
MLKKKEKNKKKKLIIITKGTDVGEFYKKQIGKLFEANLEVGIYSTSIYNDKNEILKNNKPVDKAQLYLITTDAFASKKERESKIGKHMDYVELKVDLTQNNLKELLELPDGTQTMLVNMSEIMAKEVISRLSQLGINHVKFVPVYPGMEEIPEIDIAVTPGEHRFVPKNVSKIIDIGHRSIDIDTIVELALKLEEEELLESDKFNAYFQKMAKKNYSIDKLYGKSSRLESQFERLLSALDDGIIGIDEDLNIFAINSRALGIIGGRENDIVGKKTMILLPQIGRYLEETLDAERKSRHRDSPENSNQSETDTSDGAMETRVININGINVNTSIFPIYKNQNHIGAFIKLNRFSEEELKQQNARMQLLTKGHLAKYTFEDIIGNSIAMREAVNIARKMAKTSAPILIEGESGTGKELFAHAIHGSSQRKNKPFIAINCAAMPDNLLESELFGYEEGAFTGAKKGGKLGLFEFAHTGTLFLDEVEGMSQALQVKLLRVLQEREVMRLGGHRIISVDVRIVAATNRSLDQMVEDGDFRRDLYYRLNTIQIEIPPLRDRKEDLLVLIEEMKRKVGAQYSIAEEVMRLFENYTWDGNARELQNYIEYFSYLQKPVIDMIDLPPNLKKRMALNTIGNETFRTGSKKLAEMGELMGSKINLISTHKSYTQDEKVQFVLNEIKKANENQKGIGRRSISRNALESGLKLSEQEVRTIMNKLGNMGIIKKNIGRTGSKLTIE